MTTANKITIFRVILVPVLLVLMKAKKIKPAQIS